MSAANRLVQAAARRYERRSSIGIKINLYNGMEGEATIRAMAMAGIADEVECFMVADSYLMTHLGRASTRLPTRAEQDWFLGLFTSLVAEVAGVVRLIPEARRPLLIADMPDGSVETGPRALEVAELLVEVGAEALKVEITSPHVLPVIDALVGRGYAVLAHLGYTPQAGVNRRHGATLDEAFELFRQARELRDRGAAGLVLERVGEPVNQALCRGGLPIYSIFSGKARGGGQSLNVWDAVFRPDCVGRYFPPTATASRSAYPSIYTAALLEERMKRLLEMTLCGDFPLSPPNRFSVKELEILHQTDPWSHGRTRASQWSGS